MARGLLDKCCFCIDLRSGCLIIGYLDLLFNLFCVGWGLVALLEGTVLAADGEIWNSKEVMALGAVGILMGSSALLLGSFLLIFTVLLLVGLHHDKPGLVKAYLIYLAIFLVLTVLVFFVRFFLPSLSVSSVITDIINIAINLYCLVVIRSYYHQMEERASPPKPVSELPATA